MDEIPHYSPSHRPWFWITLVVFCAACLLGGLHLFPRAFPILDLHITMERRAALAAAEQLCRAQGLGPAQAQSAASFGANEQLQNYVELRAGGVAAFRRLISGGEVYPYLWSVRRFLPGEVREVTVLFTPGGQPRSFAERLSESAPGAALTEAQARAIAEGAACAPPWSLSLAPFRRLPTSRIERPAKRVDYTFGYERTDLVIGEAPVRLYLTVSGDHFSGLSHTVEIPETFDRAYQAMRASNDLVATVDMIVVGIIDCIIGVITVIMLSRRRMMAYRPAVLWGLGIGLGLALAQLNGLPLAWMGYDTAQSPTSFRAQAVVEALSMGLFMGLLFSLSFLIAEGLSRIAFPQHPRLWSVLWGRSAASNAVLGRLLGGYLLVGPLLALDVLFYAVVNGRPGWWSPAEALTNPNMLANWLPWWSPSAMAIQAGMWEECLFRAVPLATAALIGRRLGWPKLTIGIAVIVQAVMFGAAHANYPNQPAYARLIEIALPFTVVGMVYLRYGLVVGMVMHATYDLVLMSLPLFVASGSGILGQRLAVIGVILTPLAIALVSRALCRGPARVARNGDAQPPPAAVAAPPPRSAVVTSRRTALTVLAGAGLAVLAAQILGLAEDQDHSVPRLALTPHQATARAQELLRAQGVDPAQWQAITTTGAEIAGEDDRIVWRTQPGHFAELMRHGWLWGPSTTTRFVHFSGAIETRTEEWSITLDAGGQPIDIAHTLPEDRPGPTLGADAAVALAATTLAQRFPADAAAMSLLSLEPVSRPHRQDWTLVYHRGDPAMPEALGEKRIAVTVAGDQVVNAYRYLTIPEALSRQDQARTANLAIISQIVVLVAVAFSVLVVIGGIVGCLRRERGGRRWLWVLCGVALLEVVHRALGLPAVLASFTTARPLAAQLATEVLTAGFLSLLMGGVLALLVAGYGRGFNGRGTRWSRLAGCGWAVLVAAVGAMLDQDAASPPWPPLADSDALSPALAVFVHGLLLSVALIIGLVAATRWCSDLTADWRGALRCTLGYALCLVLGAALTVALEPTTPARYLLDAVVLGVVLIISLRVVLRDVQACLPCATTLACLLIGSDILDPGFPGDRAAALLALVATILAGLWLGRDGRDA